MIDVIFLALALSMDAFAVSIGLGVKQHVIKKVSAKKLATMAAIYFGLFQGLMPLFGYLAGQGLSGWIESYAPWLAFILLLLIGGKMIYEACSEGIEDDINQITHRVMLMLAIATSIDAMAAGFALTLLEVNLYLACLIIGLITFAFSYGGVYLGIKTGSKFESKAEILGGVVLIVIGFKFLLF